MDIESTEEAGATALYLAAETGQLAVVQCLIEAGADKNAADEAGATALYTAAQYGHAEVVQYLGTQNISVSRCSALQHFQFFKGIEL